MVTATGECPTALVLEISTTQLRRRHYLDTYLLSRMDEDEANPPWTTDSLRCRGPVVGQSKLYCILD